MEGHAVAPSGLVGVEEVLGCGGEDVEVCSYLLQTRCCQSVLVFGSMAVRAVGFDGVYDEDVGFGGEAVVEVEGGVEGGGDLFDGDGIGEAYILVLGLFVGGGEEVAFGVFSVFE